METTSWAWIPIVFFAALTQTARNAAQRSLTTRAGAWGATLARFLYGIPFAGLWVLALQFSSGHPAAMPSFNGTYFAWLAAGALSQALATMLLLLAMNKRNFVVAVTYSKTEVLQAAVLGAIFLQEVPGMLLLAAMLLAGTGIYLLSVPKASSAPGEAGVFSSSALFGLASGTTFAIAAVGYRVAGLELAAAGPYSPWLIAAWSVLWAQVLQSLAIVAWLVWREPSALGAVTNAWRISLVAGVTGAVASVAWFTAYVLRPAADVRTVGMVEVVFSFLISHRLMQERLNGRESVGLVLVVIGVLASCLSL